MSLPGVTFIRREPGPSVQLGRADVAMVVGLVAREPAPLGDRLRAFLADGGWVPMTRPKDGDSAETLALLGIPVPVESWDEFVSLYRWDGREVEPGSRRMKVTPGRLIAQVPIRPLPSRCLRRRARAPPSPHRWRPSRRASARSTSSAAR